MEEYKALVAYLGVTLIIFIGALLWSRYRTEVKRRMNIKEYLDAGPESEHHSNHTHTAVGA